MPNDIDINGQMNNGLYLTLIDLMLIEYFVRIGFAKVLLKNGWRPMAGGSFITYRRGLKPLQGYTLRFKYVASSESRNFMRFEFLDGDRLCAAGYMKGAAVSKTGLVSTAQSYAQMSRQMPQFVLPAAVQHWLAAEQDVMSEAW